MAAVNDISFSSGCRTTGSFTSAAIATMRRKCLSITFGMAYRKASRKSMLLMRTRSQDRLSSSSVRFLASVIFLIFHICFLLDVYSPLSCILFFTRPTFHFCSSILGQRYYKFHGNRIPASYPSQGRPITEFHLPHSLKKIDAAFVWGRNRMTYFISGQ